MTQCAALTQKGRRCRNSAMGKTKRCVRHNEAPPSQTGSQPEVTNAKQIERENRALAMYMTGVTYDDVAAQMDEYANGSNVRRAVLRALSRNAPIEDAVLYRQQEIARLNRLQRAWWSKAINPTDIQQDVATEKVIKIIRLRAQIEGAMNHVVSADVTIQSQSPVDLARMNQVEHRELMEAISASALRRAGQPAIEAVAL